MELRKIMMALEAVIAYLFDVVGLNRIAAYHNINNLNSGRVMEKPELKIDLRDMEWPFAYTDHDRMIARAICFDEEGFFYFVRAQRDDDFGKATLIEAFGGGVEDGEELQAAIKRELKEELGVEVDVLCKLGVVSNYYNLIHWHNLNNYFLCKIISFGDKNLTQDEIESFHLSTLKMAYAGTAKCQRDYQ